MSKKTGALLVISTFCVAILGSLYLQFSRIPRQTGQVLSEENERIVSVTIDGPQGKSNFRFKTEKKTPVAEIMDSFSSKNDIELVTKEYGGSLGTMIVSINGIENNTNNNTYWTLYVNEKMAETGMSSAFVMPGDQITWRYESL